MKEREREERGERLDVLRASVRLDANGTRPLEINSWALSPASKDLDERDRVLLLHRARARAKKKGKNQCGGASFRFTSPVNCSLSALLSGIRIQDT